MRYKISFSYNGAEFHGYQIQPNASSVQQTLSSALSTLLRSKISITGAGRTDTGVNAIAYVAHFDSEVIVEAASVCYKLNAILPKSIVVHKIETAPDDFHARFDACRREYNYFLHRVKDPFLSSFSYLCAYPVLDFDSMNKAAQFLLGRHDFRCFEKVGADNKTSICTIFEAHWDGYEPCPAAWPPLNDKGEPLYWKFTISADRFLRNMVRAIVGSLIEVGRGKRSLESFASLILDADEATNPRSTSMRSLAGESVPGTALFLVKVEY